MRTKILAWPSLVAALFLVGCGDGDSFEIDIVAMEHCNGLSNIEPAHVVRLTVRGPGMEPISVEAQGSDGGLEVPDIPEGKDRVVEVEVRTGARGGEDRSEIYARGESQPFEVKAGAVPRVRVVLYRTNYFSQVVGPEGTCMGMTSPRAAHVSAALSQNEILLAGGYTSRKDGQPDGILASAEIFDLRSGTFTRVADMPSPRAEAQAVSLSDGRILVVGGVKEEGGEIVPVADAMIFDGSTWKSVEMAHGRRGHTATLIGRTGEVLVVGGIDRESQIVGAIEVFDPTTDSFRVLELAGGEKAFARAHHAAVPQGDNSVVVVGGIDEEGKVTGDASILLWDNAQQAYLAQAEAYTLDIPVMMPAAMALGSAADPKLVISGGYTLYSAVPGEPGNGTPSAETPTVQYLDLLSGRSRGQERLTMSVAGSCAVALDPNRGIVAGGARGTMVATRFGDLLRLDSNTIEQAQAGESNDKKPTAQHLSCTPVGKNGMLITGGSERDGKAKADAALYFLKTSWNQG